jgi:hypothetical protein
MFRSIRAPPVVTRCGLLDGAYPVVRHKGRKQDHGSAWEGEPNDGGEGIRKGRAKWRRLRARSERRTGKTTGKFFGSPRARPEE